MSVAKQKAFNERMGKRKKSKGGLIRLEGNLKYFADGGDTTLSGPSTSVVSQNPNTVNNNGLIGTIGSELGLNNEFQAGSANIQAGTNAAQLNNAYTQTQGALGQQQGVVNQLQPGIGQGVASQGTLTGMLTNQAQGNGPNPAQAALNQATGRNVANQAALMAGQRGAGANVGMIARQNAQQGAATQQEAAGQSATLQAQQQLAAEQNLQNLAATQVGQGTGAVTTLNQAGQNEQNILQGANTAFNNAGVGMQSNLNNVNSQVAAANQNQDTNIVGSIANGISSLGSVFGLAKGGEVHMDNGGFTSGSDAGPGLSIPATATLPTPPAKQSGGGMDSSSIMEMAPLLAMAAHGGMMRRERFARGGYSAPANIAVTSTSAPTSYVGQFLSSPLGSNSGPNIGATSALPEPGEATLYRGEKGKKGNGTPLSDETINDAYNSKPEANQAGEPIMNSNEQMAAKGGRMGGKVPAMVSPGERYLNPDEVKKVIHEGADPTQLGTVFGGKAKVKGDSLKNDIDKVTLDDGGVVLPRHIEQMKASPKMKSEKSELFIRRAVHMHAPKGGQ